MKNKIIFGIALVALGYGASAQGQEGIAFDSATGDYVITYISDEENGSQILKRKIFVPSTKIEPEVRSRFVASGDRAIRYSFQVENGKAARQSIISFVVDPVTAILSHQILPASTPKKATEIKEAAGKLVLAKKDVTSPGIWRQIVAFSRKGGLRIGWRTPHASGLQAGLKQDGFEFQSNDLPGIVFAELFGNAPSGQGLGEQGPDTDSDFGRQYRDLLAKDHVSVAVAAPVISNANPFDYIRTVRQLQAHIRSWPAAGLLSATLTSQVDGLLEQSISAFASGNQEALKRSLKAARQALKGKYPGAEEGSETASRDAKKADALAARVLTFNVKYLFKQINGGRDAD